MKNRHIPRHAKLVRIEVYPNELSTAKYGDYLVPVYEFSDEDKEGQLCLKEMRGSAFYTRKPESLTKPCTETVLLAAEGMVSAEKLFGQTLRNFFLKRDGVKT